MAGAGRRTFAPGEVLTASNVMNYLQDQAVMVFPGTAARGSAIGTAAADGMITYLQDTNSVEVYRTVGTAIAAWEPFDSPLSYNYVINGGFDIWQRGTSFTAATYPYTADRWQGSNHSAQTISRQASGLTGFQYCIRAQRNSGSAVTTVIGLSNTFETISSIPLAGKTVTLSFYARKGANLSGSLFAHIQTGTGTDQNPYSGFTGSVLNGSTSFVLDTAWARYSVTATLPTNATQASVSLYFSPTGTAGAADYFEITGVQIEVGSVATSFKRSSGTIQGELAACQRYYWRNTPNATGVRFGYGYGTSATGGNINIVNPVDLRVPAKSIDYSSGDWSVLVNSTVVTVTALALNASIGTRETGVSVTTASGQSTTAAEYLRTNATTAYIGFDAEL